MSAISSSKSLPSTPSSGYGAKQTPVSLEFQADLERKMELLRQNPPISSTPPLPSPPIIHQVTQVVPFQHIPLLDLKQESPSPHGYFSPSPPITPPSSVRQPINRTFTIPSKYNWMNIDLYDPNTQPTDIVYVAMTVADHERVKKIIAQQNNRVEQNRAKYADSAGKVNSKPRLPLIYIEAHHKFRPL